jgi:hypothetical protein
VPLGFVSSANPGGALLLHVFSTPRQAVVSILFRRASANSNLLPGTGLRRCHAGAKVTLSSWGGSGSDSTSFAWEVHTVVEKPTPMNRQHVGRRHARGSVQLWPSGGALPDPGFRGIPPNTTPEAGKPAVAAPAGDRAAGGTVSPSSRYPPAAQRRRTVTQATHACKQCHCSLATGIAPGCVYQQSECP